MIFLQVIYVLVILLIKYKYVKKYELYLNIIDEIKTLSIYN